MDTYDLREDIVRAACTMIGVAPTGLVPIKVTENATYRLASQQLVVRVAKPGQHAAAAREIQVAAWLHTHDVPAIEPAGMAQDLVMIGDRPVTFWKELSDHRGGSEHEIATALHALHALTPPPVVASGFGALPQPYRCDRR